MFSDMFAGVQVVGLVAVLNVFVCVIANGCWNAIFFAKVAYAPVL
jgi:hypothetical protein